MKIHKAAQNFLEPFPHFLGDLDRIKILDVRTERPLEKVDGASRYRDPRSSALGGAGAAVYAAEFDAKIRGIRRRSLANHAVADLGHQSQPLKQFDFIDARHALGGRAAG